MLVEKEKAPYIVAIGVLITINTNMTYTLVGEERIH